MNARRTLTALLLAVLAGLYLAERAEVPAHHAAPDARPPASQPIRIF